MNNLERSELLFQQCVMPSLKKELPEIIPFLAAGLVGEGSECFGFEDDISSDHDYGLRFWIWLPDEMIAKYEKPILAILKKLPSAFMKVPVMAQVNGKGGISGINAFYKQITGFIHGPETTEEWLSSKSPSLAASVNGKVFFDNPGIFSEVRKKILSYYPEDVRLILLAKATALAAQTGQYNYYRVIQRNDTIAAAMIKAYFVENITRIVFLLNRRYMPFYKWAYKMLKELPNGGLQIHAFLEKLLSLPSISEKKESEFYIEQVSRVIIQCFKEEGLSDSISDFLMDHTDLILRKVKDTTLQNRGISLIL